jgi:hypothetical protein
VDEEFPNGNVDFTGEFTNAVGNGAFFTANDIRGLYFDVLQPIVLNSVEVYSNTAANRTIEVIDAQGNTVVDTTVFIPASPNNTTTVTLNFTIYPGNNYFIKCRGYVDLYRNSSGAVYPYTSSLVNITNSNAGSPGYYYFFYNWTYTEITCNTSRTAVVAEDTCSTTGIEEIAGAESILLSPNPASGQVEVGFTSISPDNYRIEILNNVGEVIYTENIPGWSGVFRKKIDTSSFASGIYMVRLTNSGQSAVRKLVLRH